MSFLISVASVILLFTCMLWSEVSAQCTDPLIYKLNDIQQLIANLTAKQEKEIAELQHQLEQQVRTETTIEILLRILASYEAKIRPHDTFCLITLYML